MVVERQDRGVGWIQVNQAWSKICPSFSVISEGTYIAVTAVSSYW